MKHKITLALAGILAAGSLFAVDSAALVKDFRSALDAGDSAKLVEVTKTIRDAKDYKPVDGWHKWKCEDAMLQALVGRSDMSWNAVCTVVQHYVADYPATISDSVVARFRWRAIKGLNNKDLALKYIEVYKDSADKGVLPSVVEAYKAAGDVKTAYAVAEQHQLYKSMWSLLTWNSGVTANDSAKLYEVINIIVDDPDSKLDLWFVQNVVDKTLIRLFTASKISKDQYVSTLKKLYRRCYLNLAADRAAWEPVISSIKFGIVNAEKIDAIGL